ncbi:uncharacterized protein BDR25DRAFT_351679 [Lindgomyces ingoldianus]|uniref:Uncharacterized protein n=1 Tax=Lindgomyces ingoldianus TaxID=673940 RepID=A0ACB6R6J4_9PLEO|nr:uncharacterized protein BDR25DRAFT_351679 [Lindgomyces ingoldianus]KAF2474147.1 hypothetical protein BDR25DRAFT_351679 [Lindgomyces ingoldianus]
MAIGKQVYYFKRNICSPKLCVANLIHTLESKSSSVARLAFCHLQQLWPRLVVQMNSTRRFSQPSSMIWRDLSLNLELGKFEMFRDDRMQLLFDFGPENISKHTRIRAICSYTDRSRPCAFAYSIRKPCFSGEQWASAGEEWESWATAYLKKLRDNGRALACTDDVSDAFLFKVKYKLLV